MLDIYDGPTGDKNYLMLYKIDDVPWILGSASADKQSSWVAFRMLVNKMRIDNPQQKIEVVGHWEIGTDLSQEAARDLAHRVTASKKKASLPILEELEENTDFPARLFHELQSSLF